MKTVQIDMHPDHEERATEWQGVAEKLHEAQKMKKYFAALELTYLLELKDLSEATSSKGGNYIFTNKIIKGKSKWKLTKI